MNVPFTRPKSSLIELEEVFSVLKKTLEKPIPKWTKADHDIFFDNHRMSKRALRCLYAPNMATFRHEWDRVIHNGFCKRYEYRQFMKKNIVYRFWKKLWTFQ